MIVIMQKDRTVINADNADDVTRMLADGWRELTPAEIAAAGMTGHEHLVGPHNTAVGEDGTITFTPPAPPALEEVKADALKRIDEVTSARILAGFEFQPDGQDSPLHFSYDLFDQQNFADAANAALLAQAGTPGVPESVGWNAYRTDTGELVRLTLTPAQFLTLYVAGALAHKAACMEAGGTKKAAVEAAATAEEVAAVLAS